MATLRQIYTDQEARRAYLDSEAGYRVGFQCGDGQVMFEQIDELLSIIEGLDPSIRAKLSLPLS